MNLQNLVICRNLLDDEIFNHTADEFKTAAKLIEQAEQLGLSGNLYRNLPSHRFLYYNLDKAFLDVFLSFFL